MTAIDTNSFKNMAITVPPMDTVPMEHTKVARTSGQPAEVAGQSAVTKDSVTFSKNATAIVGENSATVQDDDSIQVGGAGVVTDGDMTVTEMKTALAEARGIDQSDVIVLNGTKKGDNINVTARKNGGITVTVNGKSHNYTAEQASRLIINGGAGNDKITVDKAVKNDLVIMGGAGNDTIQGGAGNDTIVGGKGNDTLKGGAGNDRITDDSGVNKIYGQAGDDTLIAHSKSTNSSSKYSNQIYGGSGNDYLEGGNGKDYLSGGDGYDVLYGLGGNDYLTGGKGNDYLDGGEGNDSLHGGSGRDNLIGGKGNDKLYGDSGKDLLIGCSGKDTVDGGDGKDSVITDGKDKITKDSADAKAKTIKPIDIPENFSIEGNTYETARIASDLEFLANTKQGQMMFNSIAATGHDVTIDVTAQGSSCGSYVGWNSDPNRGSDSFVHYNVSKIALNGGYNYSNRAPVVSMYHELCHSYNAATGTMNTNYYDQTTGKKVADGAIGSAKGVEWQAVGIANDRVAANHKYLTENGLRDLLGYETRTRY